MHGGRVPSTMALRVGQTRDILGLRLRCMYSDSTADARTVNCVTFIAEADEISDCRSGELLVLRDAPLPAASARRLLEACDAADVAAVLIPAGALSAGTGEAISRLAAGSHVAVGLLAVDTDVRSLANELSRSLGAIHEEPVLPELRMAETLQSVAETLGRLIGNSVTIETPAHELLASSPTGSDVDQDRVETILHRKADAKVMEHPDFRRFFARVKTSDWPQHFEARPELGFSGRVAMRIAGESELFGIIWATDTARALSEGDYGTIRQASDVAGAIFVRQQLNMRRESMLRAELVDEVVGGRISDPENIRTIGLSVGWNVERLQQALVVSIDDFEAFRLRHSKRGARLHRTQEKLIELVRLDVLAIDPGALIGMRSSSVIVLLDAHEESTAGRKAIAVRLADSIVKRVAAYLPEMHVTVGIGRDFPSLEHMAESFRQAELAAELGSRCGAATAQSTTTTSAFTACCSRSESTRG